jgi:hypothetical protein
VAPVHGVTDVHGVKNRQESSTLDALLGCRGRERMEHLSSPRFLVGFLLLNLKFYVHRV